MKYLGIDFGSKRVGLSVTDENGQMAFPYSVILNNEKLLIEVEKIIAKENIKVIVIGESKNFAMEPNKIMKEIEEFKKTLEEKIKLPIYLEPEFMTSSQAELIQGKNQMHDASAATIVLQSYIDRLK